MNVILGILMSGYLFMPAAIINPQYTQSQLLDSVNAVRLEYNRPLLKENPQLSYAAFLKAYDMVQRGYFAHHLEGEDTFQYVKQVNYGYDAMGENLAINFKTPNDTVSAWMDSKGHRKNMLSYWWEEVGVAVLCDNQGYCLSVVEFGDPYGN